MDKTLTLQQFAQMVADSADITVEEATTFINSLTSHIKELLCEGEKAHLPGIGTFAAIETKDGNATVVFAPEESFSDAVNEPFAMFEPVELSDHAAIDIAEAEILPNATPDDTTPSNDTKPEITEPETPAIKTAADTTEPVKPVSKPTTVEQPTYTATSETPISESSNPTPPTLPHPTIVTATPPVPHSRQYRLGWLCLGIAIGAIIGYLVAALVYTGREMAENEEYGEIYDETTEYADSFTSVTAHDETNAENYQPVASPAADILCTDTVTVRRYITHMAKDYYGDRNFWVYIYEANKDVLGHPERTLPGTIVSIPAPSSIPANPTNPEDIKKAKQLAAEIYSRFQ